LRREPERELSVKVSNEVAAVKREILLNAVNATRSRRLFLINAIPSVKADSAEGPQGFLV
jgi:hypothetical protein